MPLENMGMTPENIEGAGMPASNIQQDPESFERMASPEEMEDLQVLMDRIEGKYREMSSRIISGENGTEALRQKLVGEVFKAMEEAGVDLNNVESVGEFLDELKQTNIELYEMFVAAFNHLIGEEGEGMMPEGEGMMPEGEGMMPEGEGMMPGGEGSVVDGLAGAGMAPPPMSPGEAPSIDPSNPELGGMANPSARFPNLANMR